MLEQLGEDVGRLSGAARPRSRPRSAPSRKLGVDDVEPFLGEAGAVPPWDLTDAIDRGDTAAALVTLRRMLRAGERHPLQVMATLHSHYARMLRLDGAGVRERAGGRRAARRGARSRPRRRSTRRAGSATTALVRAFDLLAEADLDLRGSATWPDELVLEVLVARLAALAPCRRPAQPLDALGREAQARSAVGRGWRFFIRRLLRRAASFLWMTPLRGGLVEALLGRAQRLGGVVGALVGGRAAPSSTRVFSSDWTALLRSVRLAFVWLRFIWLLMFATRPGSFACGRRSGGPGEG